MINQRTLRPWPAVCASIFLSLLWPGQVLSAPSVTSVSGDFGPGGLVQVSGSSFGVQGPTILLFDDFEGVDVGSPIPLESPTIGAWSNANHEPLGFDLGRSGSRSFLGAGGKNLRQLQLKLGAKHRDAFVSYWVRLAPGSYFPGNSWPDGRRRNHFSQDSSWKFSWLMEGDGASNPDLYDLCLPTHTGGGGIFQTAGNSIQPSGRYIGNSPSWWNWNGWMRMSFTIRDPSNFPGDDHMESQIVGTSGFYTKQHSPVFDKISKADQNFDTFNVPGWLRWRDDGNADVLPLYDDIYIAVGPGASARAELVDAPVYEHARQIEILLTESWSENQINVRVPRAVDLNSGGTLWYLFVTDAQGHRNAVGVPVGACAQCPQEPDPVGIE
jgi:hypothetical protein